MSLSPFEQAITSLRRQGIKYDLERMRVLADLLAHPEARFRSLHVAGTNGKGSTAAFLAAILQVAGYRVGLNTSPHLVAFRERIRVDGRGASDEDLMRLYERALPSFQEVEASFFEAATMLGFLTFAEAGVDVAVVEVGLGGRLDATNILTPLGSVITSIDLEHTRILGDTVEKIAAEKAGIIKRHPVVTSASQPAVREVIARIATERGADLEILHKGTDWSYEPGVLHWRPATDRAQDYRPSLAGEHQAENAACALALSDVLHASGILSIPDAARRTGIEAASWPGRFQIHPHEGRTIVFDVAHNALGARYLARTLEERFPAKRVVAVVGMLRDKDHRGYLRALAPAVEKIWTTTPPHEDRDLSAEALALECRAVGLTCEAEPDVGRALLRALAEGDPVLVTGSLFTVGAAMRVLALRPEDGPAGLDTERATIERTTS